MWHAKCDYIQQLLPTHQFAKRMIIVHEEWNKLIQRGLLNDRIYQLGTPNWLVGGKRYVSTKQK